MALLLRGEMRFLWQHREGALQDLQEVADMSDISTEVGVAIIIQPHLQLLQVRIHALLQRAYIYCDTMETSRAQAECDKAIKLNSRYGDIYVQMAKVHLPW